MYEEKVNFNENKEEELRRVRVALLNVLEDTDEARKDAVGEKNKTMAIIENLTDGIVLLNEENEVVIASHPVMDFFRKGREDVVGKGVAELMEESEFKPLRDLLLDEERNRVRIVFRQEVSIGGRLNLEVSTVFLSGESEEGGILIILHDVTRDKLVERMKTEFVSIAAHQLRTPLSAIKWTLRMVLDGDVGELSGEQKELLEKTYVSNERMIELINDLLNISRIEEGRFLYRQEPGQLEEVIKKVIDSSQDLFKMKKIRLGVKLPKGHIPAVDIDREKMEVVVQNLLENAIKYTPEGGEVTVSLKKEKSELVFEVGDTGVGISEADHERIFTKFFRGDNVIKMETEGSGLGLYATKNIVEAHRGKIWFESKEGEGTSFYFSLPVIG